MKFPSFFSRIFSSIGSKTVNLDLSLVSCSIQVYELPHVDQEIFLYQNQVSDFSAAVVERNYFLSVSASDY